MQGRPTVRTAWHLVALTIVAAIAVAAAAAPPEPYKAVGAPAEPRIEARWNRFYDYDQATDLLKRLAKAHPKLARLQSLGKSHGGRDIWLLRITNFDRGCDRDKPAFWIDGGIHANEIQSVETVLYTAWYLLEMHDRHEPVQRLLADRAFYLLPMLSPDSRHAHFHRPNTTSTPRGGQRPVDDDRDGLTDEDGPDDLNGDGHITQMRVADPNGRMKPHPKFPQYLIPVEPGERGQFTLLGQEGFDNDHDGRVNEDGDGYYDPNRNWPWQWQPEYVQRGAHRYPLSIAANRLAADFIMAHRNIAGAQSYHNTGGMILRGPGVKGQRVNPADARVFDTLAKQGIEMLPDYRYLRLAEDMYEGRGVELDWMYQMQGVFTFTNELFTWRYWFRQDESTAEAISRSELQHRFDKYLLLGEGIVPWQAVDHPQYGKIEVGGMKKNWGRQPPSFMLEEECHRNMAFTLYHADQMPQVRIQSAELQRLDGDLLQLTVAVENQRLTPTRAAVDVQHKITPADVVSVEADGLDVVLALTSPDRFFTKPVEQPYQQDRVRVDTIGGHGVVFVRWLLRTRGEVTVRVKSHKGGADEKVVGVED